MDNIFDKFNQAYGGEALAKEVDEITKNGGSGENVPYGRYEVRIEKLELTSSKSNKPMLTVWFKVIAGNQKDRIIFMNQLLDAAFKIHIANEFLKSLDTCVEVKFDGDFNHYAATIKNVYSDLTVDGLEYQLNYYQNKKGFDEFKIEEVFETK